MNKCIINNKVTNRKIKESKNNKENQRNEHLKVIILNLLKFKRKKVIPEDSKEREERFLCHNEINKQKIYYNKIVHKNRTKALSNIKFYFLLQIIISFINHFLPFFESKSNKLLFKLSDITVAIKEKGNIKIFSDDFFRKYKPIKILINDNLTYTNINELYFEPYNSEEVNIIKVIWK